MGYDPNVEYVITVNEQSEAEEFHEWIAENTLITWRGGEKPTAEGCRWGVYKKDTTYYIAEFQMLYGVPDECDDKHQQIHISIEEFKQLFLAPKEFTWLGMSDLI